MPATIPTNREAFTGLALWCVLVGLLLALWLLGCANKAGGQRPPLQVPPMPPTPTINAASNVVHEARVDVEAAQTNLRTGTARVEKGDTALALPPLKAADGQLTSALGHFDQAKEKGAELQARIDALAKGHEAQVAAYRQQLSAVGSQLSASEAESRKLKAENSKLRNEVLRKAQLTIGGVGSFLLLAAIGCGVAGIWFGFAPGVRIAVIAGSAGGAAVSVAVMLPKIVLGFEIAAIAAVAVLLGWIGYRLWRAHRDTLDHVIVGVQQAKDELAAEGSPAVASIRKLLKDATTDADKLLIAARKKKVIQP